MKVRNVTNANGRAVANQFIIDDDVYCPESGEDERIQYFQSYDSIIVRKNLSTHPKCSIQLDINKWDYSTTTGKYRNQFLSETKRETEKKIKSGEYQLVDLN